MPKILEYMPAVQQKSFHIFEYSKKEIANSLWAVLSVILYAPSETNASVSKIYTTRAHICEASINLNKQHPITLSIYDLSESGGGLFVVIAKRVASSLFLYLIPWSFIRILMQDAMKLTVYLSDVGTSSDFGGPLVISRTALVIGIL